MMNKYKLWSGVAVVLAVIGLVASVWPARAQGQPGDQLAHETIELAVEEVVLLQDRHRAGRVQPREGVQRLADLLGRQMATPVAIQGSDKLRPAAYRTGCEALLLTIATRFGLDVDPFLALMDRSRSEEASKVGAT